MSTDVINKAVVTQFIAEVFESFSAEHLPFLLTQDFRVHDRASHGVPQGPRQIQPILGVLTATYRDARVSVQDLIAEGDMVVARYLFEAEHIGQARRGNAPGRRVRMPGILIARMRNQKLAECWWEEDRLGMLQQIHAA